MKRTLDFLLAFLLLLALAVPFVLIAISIRIVDGSPIFFRQVRIGQNLEPFSIWKFRTMRRCSEMERSLTVGADSRITRTGLWLRRNHLDELPQLFNILLGEMSFIGPRPEIPEFVDPTNLLQQQVGALCPGLFDPAALYYENEAEILAKADDWRDYYKNVILPDKLKRSFQYFEIHTWRSDISLLINLIRYLLKKVTKMKKIKVFR